ncbi:hypothetical protein CSV75_08635 [Sporosarcina sp. P18a]|uniref:hypothetical protein n=1 Tax=Sporosarcina sp. P18a TaxID=2048259 RepID=UPI000C168FEE|nr:hypothetical protein [Sporosarcina sp. P18a]PIC80026.1 hypothetical protein CSV75_08635 [Sporosarcina sp. P18a]
MKKTLTYSLVALVAATALVPVVSTQAASANSIKELVFTKDGKDIKISNSLYQDAFTEGLIRNNDLKYIQLDNLKYYNKDLYSDAISEFNSNLEALKYLAGSNKHSDITPVDGEFKNGQLVATEPDAEFFEVTDIE